MLVEIKDFIGKCDICNSYQKNQQKEFFIFYDFFKCFWLYVVVDFFIFNNKEWFIIVDYWLDYFELNLLFVINVSIVIIFFKNQFVCYGILDMFYSDNGLQFLL